LDEVYRDTKKLGSFIGGQLMTLLHFAIQKESLMCVDSIYTTHCAGQICFNLEARNCFLF